MRSALLDLQSAADQVAVARTNVDLATETLAQARDRFTAGVTDNIEVVQAQQLLASANENYIESLNAHNGAKIALATEPQILLLDEPVAGMSRDEARKTELLIRKLAAEMTVLIIEHDMDLIMGISDSITVLESGRVLANGTPAEIRANQRVQDAYLGGHSEAEMGA